LELPCAAAFAFLAWKIHKEKTDALKNPELHGRTRKAWENPLSAPNLATDVFAISSAFFAADWVYTRMKLRKTIAKAFHNVVSGDVFERKQLERQARNQEQDSLQ
jgi:hypothetical protein